MFDIDSYQWVNEPGKSVIWLNFVISNKPSIKTKKYLYNAISATFPLLIRPRLTSCESEISSHNVKRGQAKKILYSIVYVLNKHNLISVL